MRCPDLIDLAVVGVAVGLGWVGSRGQDPFWPTLFFAVLVLAILGLLVRLGVQTAWVAAREGRQVRELRAVDPHEAAREAVVAERARLSADIDAALRETLLDIESEIGGLTAGEDPRPQMRRVQLRAREATGELRRQLGLLRSATGHTVGPGGGHQATGDTFGPGVPRPARPASPARPDRRDVAVALAVGVVAALEAAPWPGSASGHTGSPVLAMALTVLAAVTVVGRRTHATLAALVCAGAFALGWVLPGQVVSGAWMLAGPAVLVWTLARHRPSPARLAAGAVLATVAVATRLAEDPDNAPILLVALTLAAVIGALVGRNRRRSHEASRRSARLRAGHELARHEAVAAERLQVARELHDVVSHAVGVIAAQAAAAEVSWPGDPATADRAVAVIGRTAREALAELGGVVPSQAPTAAGYDVSALVGRMRAAGVEVTCHADAVPPTLGPVVYRVVQEALTNAVRHAPGAAIDMRIMVDEAEVTVRVSDDGPGAGGSGRGFGLTGLEERVRLAGGRLRHCSGDGGGFVVEAELPLVRVGAP